MSDEEGHLKIQPAASLQATEEIQTVKEVSPHAEEYRKVMHPFEIDILDDFSSQLQMMQIRVETTRADGSIQIQEVKTSQYHQIIETRVKIGCYSIPISINNLSGHSPTHSAPCIGQGNYGRVYQCPHDSLHRVIKCLPIKQSQTLEEEILEVLLQYGLLSLSSALGCAPNTRYSNFNITLYKHKQMKKDLNSDKDSQDYIGCIQFEMQKCQKKSDLSCEQHQQLLKTLYTLHSAGLVHNDIKPPNILYSNYHQKLVFIDYGISMCPLQPMGQQTFITFRGTYNYCGPQMAKLYHDKQGKVDLYWNDTVGLQQSLQQMLTFIPILNSNTKLQQNYNMLIQHRFILELKYHLHFQNQEGVRQIVCLIKWNSQNKLDIFRFLLAMPYLSSTIKYIFRTTTTWQDISDVDSVGPLALLGEITTSLHFTLAQPHVMEKKQFFESIYQSLLMVMSKKVREKLLRKMQVRKERRKMVGLLCNWDDISTLKEEVYSPLLFSAVNFLKNRGMTPFSKKIQMCRLYHKYINTQLKEDSQSQKNQSQLNQEVGDIQQILYFFQTVMQIAIRYPEHPLRLLLSDIYANHALLALTDQQTLTLTYQLLPNLPISLPQRCDTFYLIHTNSFWFTKTSFLPQNYNYLDFKKISLQTMKKLALQIDQLSNQHHQNCQQGFLCFDREDEYLQKIYSCSKLAGNSYKSLENKLKQCQIIISTIKNSLVRQIQETSFQIQPSFQIKRQNPHKVQSLKFRQWEIPSNLPQLFHQNIQTLNSSSYLTTTNILQQLIPLKTINIHWYPSLMSSTLSNFSYLSSLSSLHKYPQVSPHIVYLQSFYQLRRYLVSNYLLIAYDETQRYLLLEQCSQLMRIVGNKFSTEQLATYLVELRYEQCLSIWWYLKEVQGESARITDILKQFKSKLQQANCKVKLTLKTLQSSIFTNLYLNPFPPEPHLTSTILSPFIHKDSVLMQLRFIEICLINTLNNCERFQISRNTDLLCYFNRLINQDDSIYEHFVTSKLRKFVSSEYLIHLLHQKLYKPASLFLQKLTQSLLQHFHPQTQLTLFQLRAALYNYFTLTRKHPLLWRKARKHFLLRTKNRHNTPLRLISIFTVYLDLIFLQIAPERYSTPTSLLPRLYRALCLHPKITPRNIHDIQLAYRCRQILGVPKPKRGNQKKRRYWNYIGRKHKKLIQLCLSRRDYKQQVDQLHQCSECYQITLTHVIKHPQYHYQLAKQQMMLFKRQINHCFRSQQKQNRFDIYYKN